VTSLQKIAMGLVIVLVDAFFAGYDAVPDPLGWAMVMAGVATMRPWPAARSGLLLLAGLSLVVSLAVYPPDVLHRLDASGGWALSLPQLAFSFVLCGAAAAAAPQLSGRLLLLRWVFAVGAVGPVLVFGGGLDALASPLAVLLVAATIYLIFLLFRASSALSRSE
jgi:hypothetical protein